MGVEYYSTTMFGTNFLDEVKAQIDKMQRNSEELNNDIRILREENVRLRAKTQNQRRELRRLNKIQRAIWDGVRFEQHCIAERGKQYRERLSKEGKTDDLPSV